MTAEEIARALGGKRSGRQWLCRCPAHDDRSPSLLVFDGEKAVQLRCQVGCKPIEIIDALKARGLWGERDLTKIDQQRRGDAVSRETVSREPLPYWNNRMDEGLRNFQLARQVFDDSREIEGTLAEKYLRSRHLIADLPLISPNSPAQNECAKERKCAVDMADVRYHARCPRGDERVPALVIAMRQMAGVNTMHAVQRIFLDGEGRKDGKPMMLGPAGGTAMMLTPRHEAFGGELSYCDELTVCEGFETGLAALLLGYKNVWALGSAGAMRTLPVLFGVGSLVICADHDRPVLMNGKLVRPGEAAAEACATRWRGAGRVVSVKASNVEGHDLADVWSAQHA